MKEIKFSFKTGREHPAYFQLMRQNPSWSLIAACVYLDSKFSDERLRQVVEEFLGRYGTDPLAVTPERVEELTGIGISVVDKVTQRIIRSAPPNMGKYIVVFRDVGKSKTFRSRQGLWQYSLQPDGILSHHPIICEKCNVMLKSVRMLAQHLRRKNCHHVELKTYYKGGGFLKDYGKNMWNVLMLEGLTIPPSLQNCQHMIVFDFEAKQQQMNDRRTTNLTRQAKLDLVSFAVHTNVPSPDGSFDPLSFAAGEDPAKVFEQFWTLIERVSDASFALLEAETRPLFQRLYDRMEMSRNGQESYQKSHFRLLNRTAQSLHRFIRQIPVVGFNSGSFDLPLVKKYLAEKLSAEHESFFTAKNGHSYRFIKTNKFRFLDLCEFVAPGYSLEGLLKAYLPNETQGTLKGVFPYEWLTSYEKAKTCAELPPREAFSSTLAGGEISEDKYLEALRVWHSLGPNATMLDYLRLYNMQDVDRLLSVALKMMEFWREKAGVNMLREGLTLPGLAVQLAYKRMAPASSILLATQSFSEVNEMLDKGFVGGPSIVFTRYAKANETLIKENLYGGHARMVRSIVSYDLNSLYAYAMCHQPMPTGNWLHLTPTSSDGQSFHGEWMHRFYFEETEWLSYLQLKEKCAAVAHGGHQIIHKFNGGPVKVGHDADGFCENCLTAFFYDGPAFHGRCPECPQTPLTKSERLRDSEKRSQHRKECTEILRLYPNLKIERICGCQWKKRKSESPELRRWCADTVPRFPKTQSKDDILAGVQGGKWFGLLEVQIIVPEELVVQYSDFPPFFLHADLNLDLLEPQMRDIGQRLGRMKSSERRLVSSLEADHFVVISPLLKFYLKRGFKVLRIYQALRCKPSDVFEDLGVEIHGLRCAASTSADLAPTAETMKLITNSVYGKSCENKAKHKTISFCSPQDLFEKHSKDRLFVKAEEITDSVVEIEMKKKSIVLDSPKILGIFILGYAKLQITRFAYVLKDMLDDKDFQFMLMDTDSLALSLASRDGDIDSLVRPEKQQEWSRIRHRFLPMSQDIAEQKRFGIFKQEFLGTELVALSAKSYFFENSETGTEKSATKGVSKRHNAPNMNAFKRCLFENEVIKGQNRGFQKTDQGEMFLYEQGKDAQTPFYAKRLVSDNGIDTMPIRFPEFRPS